MSGPTSSSKYGVQTDAVNILGPGVFSLFVQGLQTGVLITQSIHFWERSKEESRLVKLLVAFVSVVAGAQSIVSFYEFWDVYVTHFGELVILYGSFGAVNASKTPLIALLLGSISTSLVVTHDYFHRNYTKPDESIYVPYVLCLVFSALVDITLSCILLSYLCSSLKRIHTERIRRRVYSLMISMWEASLPPSACAVAIVIAYIIFVVHVQYQFWVIGLQSILGKLHVISLFFILYAIPSSFH
ncbi:hypothetical protein BV25DRAFT_1913753 [Artomyces pyxidatus]|uniref:Uncharacterized protein n=1 Tax=Artomyces pyxidatus TaxID=48021 RepID=A0ACB8T9H5_9AGAM|nr:hypothetical protein BV25DRAFT_1913753 [Artomyces pyxidatus]